MPRDNIKTIGQLKSSKPESGGAIVKSVPVIGIVKDNVDPNRAGRIFVYIADFGGSDPNNKKNWVPVNYMSPFFGRTNPDAGEKGYGKYKLNPSSYGVWNSPPDIGTQVICIFINGDMDYGYYIGCIPEPEALRMIPAIGANQEKEDVLFNKGESEKYGGVTRVPVTNMNTNNESITDSAQYINAPKPAHSYTAMIMHKQGILRDPIRGPISTSSQRETPSRVGWGVSTPGRPIYEGGYDDETIVNNLEDTKNPSLRVIARRGGHSIVMDDGDIIGRDQLIRIRTSLGHQILMSDDGETLMLLHANGQSYIELGKEGTVDIYSTNSINLRTQGDLNLHADNNINIHAAKDMNIQATNLNVNTEAAFNQRVGTDYQNATFGKHTTKVNGACSIQSEGDASLASSAIAYVNGSKVNLNTGKTSTVPAEVKPIPVVAHTDTLLDKAKGYLAAPGKLLSITSRAPAHCPWENAGQGVNVKTDLNASSQLPAAPSGAVSTVNNVAPAVQNPVSVATSAAMPKTGAVSAALDKNTTGSLLGAMATNAAATAGAAVTQGAAIVQSPTGQLTAVVGQFAQTPTQLQASNILKPGSAPLVNSLVSAGANASAAMTSNMFTGKPGAGTLTSLVNNVGAQATSVVNNLQQSQTALTNSGAITGKESGTQIGGLVMAGVTAGVSATLGAVKSILSPSPAGSTGIGSQLSGAASGAWKSISSGNFAANLAGGVTSGLGSIGQSVGAMSKSSGLSGLISSAKGVAASAFSAISSSLKPFKPNVPQNLASIARQADAATASVSAGQAATPAALASAAISATAGVASGINKLPGGQGAVSNIINNSLSPVNQIPGGQQINSLIKQASTSALNGLASPNSLLASASKGLTSLASSSLSPGASSQLQAAISSLSSGGGTPIKMPSIGIKTNNTSSMLTQMVNVLGDSGIPLPKTDNKDASAAALEQKEAITEEMARAEDERLAALIRYNLAKERYPQGDPKIASAKAEYESKKVAAENAKKTRRTTG